MRCKLFSIIVIALLISSFAVVAHEGEATTPTTSMMQQSTMPSFCNSPEECMSFCKDNPEKCQFEMNSELRDDDYKERIKLKSEYGEFEYKYKSELEGTNVIDIEYEEKNFHFDELKSEFFIMGKMMEGLDPGQFEEFMQTCPDVNSMVDGVINKLKESERWDISKACDRLEDEVSHCEEKSKAGCENIKQGSWLRYDSSDIKCGEDVSKESFYNLCISRSSFSNGEFNAEEICEKKWDSVKEDCERRRDYCEQSQDRQEDTQSSEEQREISREQETQIEESETRNGDETMDDSSNSGERSSEMMTGMVVYSGSCDLGSMCDRDNFINQCLGEMGSRTNNMEEMMRDKCNSMAENMVEQFRQSCSQRDEVYDRCLEATQRHCGPMGEAVKKCRSVTEDDIRSLMIEHGTKMCKFMDNKDKNEIIKMMLRARGHLKDRSDLQLVFDDETEDVIEAKEEIKNIDNKSVGYKFKKFLGLAAEQERSEAAKLKASAEKLRETSEFLRNVADATEDSTGKSALLEQAINIEKEAEKLEEMAEEKIEKANGIWSIFSASDEESEEGK